MNKNFTIMTKEGNAKIATCIVKLEMESKNYLIYSLDENEHNKQIFTSRLIINSEGKNFIEDLLPEEKAKLNNLIYNIVILLPSNYQKGASASELLSDLENKYALKLDLNFPNLENQEYYNYSSIAITDNSLVESAISFYSNNLNTKETHENDIPVWDIPFTVEENKPSFTQDNFSSISGEEKAPEINQNDLSTEFDLNITSPINTLQYAVPTEENPSNSSAEQVAVVSDPNLANAINYNSSDVEKSKESGFASSKYIIIGTVCFVLSIVVVVAVVLLIKNKQ